MEKRILITYASKHGATAQIAEKIGAVLKQADLSVDVLPIDRVNTLKAYQAVVLGSAVYVGQWRKEASEFLQTHESALTTMPVWLFSSGPTGEGDPEELLQGWTFPDAQKPVVERIRPREVVVFHGVLDMKKLSFGEKLIVKGVKAQVGDFRNWDAITAWANSIVQTLEKEAWTTHPTA